MPGRRRLVAGLVALVAAVAVGDAAAAPAFKPCRAQLEHAVECASVTVELDRTKAVPGTLALHVERIRAKARPARGTMFVLSGGPGESVSAGTDAYAEALAPARATRDLVLVDQRGTGLSGALRCPADEEDEPTTGADDQVAECGAVLGPRVSLFTLSDVVADLEDVRSSLGIARIDLYGVSYGTRVALAYAARYPQHVDRLILDSVVPLAEPNSFGLNSMAAVPRVLAEVCAGACAFTQDPAAELAALVRRLAGTPVTGRVARGDGRLHRVRMAPSELYWLLLAADFLPSLRAHFPAAVHSALAGDPAPLLRLRELAVGGVSADPRDFSMALYLATSCAETAEPWVSGTTPAERSAAARAYLANLPDERFAPFDRAIALAASSVQYCRAWPRSGHALRFVEPLPDVPTLLLSGTADLRTPLEDARVVASLLPRAQLVPLRGAGHAVLFQGSACAARAVSRFLAGLRTGRCPKLHSASAAGLVPSPARATSTVDAVAPTLRDVLTQLPLTILGKSVWGENGFLFYVRAGGLRGGRYSASLGGITLERVSVVPGVTVSGRLKGLVDPFEGAIYAAQGELRVTGPGGRRGVLTVGRDRFTGVFDGRRVSRPLRLGS